MSQKMGPLSHFLLFFFLPVSFVHSYKTIRSEFAELVQGRAAPPTCGPLPGPSSKGPTDVHGLISSPGGTGSSYVLQAAQNLNLSVNVGNAKHMKHTPHPPFHNPSFYMFDKGTPRRKVDFELFKTVYVFGDPIESIVSLFRRGYQKRQIKETSGGSCGIHRLRKRIRYNTHHCPFFLESYTKDSEYDFFRFNEHYIHWIFSDTPYDRIFISGRHSEDIFANFPLDSLFLYPSFSAPSPASSKPNSSGDIIWKLKNSNNIIQLLHSHRKSSDRFLLPKKIVSDLGRPFQALLKFIENLPLIFVKPGTSNTYRTANATTFEEKLADKFIGDFNMDELLDTVLPEIPSSDPPPPSSAFSFSTVFQRAIQNFAS